MPTFTYDPAGNLTKEINPLGEFFYSYIYYRPLEKRYSYMTGNDVTYEYGTSGNDKGRLVFVTDGSGSYECHYDALGNVTDEIRTIALPHNGDEVYRFHMGYTYDSWGRMHTMTYPDGEEITYSYQWGGDLLSMNGNNPYINEIRYNAFGQRDSIVYGNGTRAKYTYDALHRLKHLSSYTAGGIKMQDIDYTFDKASNIKIIHNDVLPIGSFAGSYQNGYKYDNLNRLVFSDGDNMLGQYDMEMQYSPSGRIAHKYYNTPSGALSRPVDMYYGYCDQYQPHAVKRIFDDESHQLFDLRWDEAGNLGQVSIAKPGEMFDAGRFLFWTEDNRMHTAVDDKHYSYYAYDYGGERRLKLVGDNSSVDVNAEYMNASSALNEPTLYPSAYMVLTNKGYTKHYYAGTERVAARLGGGGLNAQYHVIDNDEELQTKADMLFKQSLDHVNHRVLDENDLDCIMGSEFAKEEFGHWIDGIPCQMKADVECDHGLFKEMVHSMLDDRNHGVYFYHSDHLGSASWITDSIGIPIQHLQYLPYGEPYIDQRAAGTTYRERFRFTGKERDEETGYGYFGARYMDHELVTMWLSVDPMMDKYPSISPYAYCAWNPLSFIDRNGDSITLSSQSWEILKYAFSATFKGGMDNVPFSYNSEDGKLLYEPIEGMEYSAEEQTIIDNFSSLCTNEVYHVDVEVIDNDFYYWEINILKCLNDKDNLAIGVTINHPSVKRARCYISSNPLYTYGGKVTEKKYKEAYQALAIMHEVGGHAYYYSKKISGEKNGELTTTFENLIRSVYKGKSRGETREIRNGKALERH